MMVAELCPMVGLIASAEAVARTGQITEAEKRGTFKRADLKGYNQAAVEAANTPMETTPQEVSTVVDPEEVS